MDLPLEILEHIISFCLPLDLGGNVSVFWEEGETRMRLVCRLFDDMWSRAFVVGVFAGHASVPHDIKDIWPLDSVLWFVRTMIRIYYEKWHGRSSSQCDTLRCIFTTVDALHKELQGGKGEAQDVLEKAILFVCTSLVFNHEFYQIMRRLAPEVWDLSPIELEQQDQVNATDISSLLPIFAASRKPDLMRDILTRTEAVSVNYASELFGCAIYNAAAVNDVEVVKLLIAHGADVNQTGGRWHTPCQASCTYAGATDALSTLLEAGADVNLQDGCHGRTALMTASKAGNTQAVTILLAHPDVNVHLLDCNNESILHYLCRAGDSDNVRRLLAQHPTIDVQHNAEYGTALHAAMNLAYDQFTDGHDQIVEILLDRGLSPRVVSWGSETCIIGWAKNIKEEAECEMEEVPAAVKRILRWGDAFRGSRSGSSQLESGRD